MKRKIIFLDCDGTIMDATRDMLTVSNKTKYAVKELIKNGHLVYIASGRCDKLISDDIKEIHPTGFITTNGAHCYNNSGIVYSYNMKEESIKAIIDSCEKYNGVYFLETQDHIYTKDTKDPLYLKFVNAWKCSADTFTDVKLDESYQLAMTAFNDEKDCLCFESDLKNTVDIRKQYGFTSFDVGDFGIDKGYGIKKVLDYYGIDKKDAYAFGDGLNDLEMLQEVEESYCMENGNDKLKALAKHVAPDVLDDGFYQAMVWEGLIKPIE